jgi:hypothetical protein
MLEIAYWIGPEAGNYNRILEENHNLHRYRDLRQQGRSDPHQRDRWVVFHFHLDETRDQVLELAGQNGHNYTGFASSPSMKEPLNFVYR